MPHSVKKIANIDKNILDLFYRLSNNNTAVRLKASSDIFLSLWNKQQGESGNSLCEDLKYCIERLVKGLASPRDSARLGYALLLTEILKKFDNVQVIDVLEFMKKHLITSSSQEKICDYNFGQLFAYTAIIRSGKLCSSEYLPEVILALFDLCSRKTYVLNACQEVLHSFFSELSAEIFKDKLWPLLKKKLKTDWENCSAETLWMLLLCICFFPDCVSAKYLKKCYGAEDIFAFGNLENIKKIMKTTTSTLPMLHPLCSVFYEIIRERKNFKDLWSAVIDDNLFNLENTEKACIGFEMIKLALQKSPTKKIIKTILSNKFQKVFSRSYQALKHPLNPAATHLANFLCNYAKDNPIPDIQILILKVFVHSPGTVLLNQHLKRKEVSLIIQNLLPDAVKAFCEILKVMFLRKKLSDDVNEKEINNKKRLQAAHQIAILTSHSSVLADVEWRMSIIKFLFLHSFFTIKEPTSDIMHCDVICEPFPDSLQDTCANEFFKALNCLHVTSEKKHSPLSDYLQNLLAITEYAEQLMDATENVNSRFSKEKVEEPWKHLKTIIHKLCKQSKKDGQVNESNAFQTLFLQLGLLLFQDPDQISGVLEELYICCKKALKIRKKDNDNSDLVEGDLKEDPPWIGVVIDILLSLLSKSSKHLRELVTYVFPLFCSFINEDALQQILDVVNVGKEGEDMLIEETDENENDVEFGSGSSSEESENEIQNENVDEEFKKKVQDALGSAADCSDVESVALSDSEMFKLDDAISEAFKSKIKSGTKQLSSEDKTLLHFRIRCFDLIMAYLKSEPSLHLVLMCIEPVLSSFELGHQGKHQSPLLEKSISVLHFISKMKKFKNYDVNESELKRLLEILMPKCHKEINLSIAQKLYSLCLFIVLCYRRLKPDIPDYKDCYKVPLYVQTYLSNLDTFVSKGNSNMYIHFFTQLMEACPDLAWYFIEPCQKYSFSSNIRLFKKTQCLGLLLEAIKYSKNQKEITSEQWLELGNNILPLGVESLKTALNSEDIKPLYTTELLDFVCTIHQIIKEKTKQDLPVPCTDILPLLQNLGKSKKMKSLKAQRRKFIYYFKGMINNQSSNLTENDDENVSHLVKRKVSELDNEQQSLVSDTEIIKSAKKSKHKRRKTLENSNITVNENN